MNREHDTMVQRFDPAAPLPEEPTLVLEASAGTGKTYAIAAIAARLVADGVPLSAMMIVTFSRMATAELRSRVRQRLEDVAVALARVEGPDEDDDAVVRALATGTPEELSLRQRRIADALADFDAATIATTHEFCHRMLSGLGSLAPFDAQPRFAQDLSGLVREVALDVWLDMFADDDSRKPLVTPEEAVEITRRVLLSPEVTIGPEGRLPRAAELRVRLATRARQVAEQRQAARQLTTYDDMLSVLLDALSDPDLGPAACRRLAERFPVVLIDEFQDTDPQQWQIIEKAFVGSSRVFLIGDPKQAIYGFRGADVRAYLAAVERGSKRSLPVNWRSDAPLVEALAGVIGGAALGDDRILVTEVEAAHADQRFRVKGARWAAPFRLRLLAVEEGDPVPTASDVRDSIDADLAEDIAALLDAGAEVCDGDDWRPLRRRDVAVLVSSNRAGQRVAARLAEAGVPALCTGAGSVFTSIEARDWHWLLLALTEPTVQHVRQVGLTAFHGWDASQLATADSAALSALGARVRGWAATLREGGMAALSEQVLGRGSLQQRVLSHRDGERVLTDLRHVAQLLQAAEATGIGPAGLVDWLADRIVEAVPEGDDASRRQQSDADAVQVMTIHRAKGLEFPVVYLPEASDRWAGPPDKGAPIVLHTGESGSERMIDAGGRSAPQRRDRFERHRAEEAGEDLRELYVALTRARSRITAWWAVSRANLSTSSLHRVLSRDPSAGAHPDQEYAELSPATIARAAALPGVDVQRVTAVPTLRRDLTREVTEVFPAVFTRAIDHGWRRTSYSGLTAGVHALPAIDAGVKEPDEPPLEDPALLGGLTTEMAAPVSTIADEPSPFAGLAGGTQFGSLVHAVLERVDTSIADLDAELLARCREQLARIPVTGLTAEDLAAALSPVMVTPLGPLADGRRLSDIPPSDRLAELDFELPLGGDGGHALLSDLADLIEAHLPEDDVLARYPASLRADGLGEQSLRGFLTGSIDALLRVGEAHLVVDYKTNRLGAVGAPLTVGDYTIPAMADAMIAAHYPLQALLYGVATHRFLRWRLSDYDPERHLGGVLYLFVRGMAGPAAATPEGAYGVFTWRPPAALVVALSDRIGGLR